MEQSKLTIKQEKFAQEYVLSGNASAAYRVAYPTSLKWKDGAVYTQSSILLSDSKVLERVNELRGEIKTKFDVSAERLILEQSRIALFDFRNLFDEEGKLLPVTDFPDNVAAAVASIKINRVRTSTSDSGEQTTEDIVELKLWNKNNSIDSLFKHKGLYSEDNIQKRPVVIVKDFAGGE